MKKIMILIPILLLLFSCKKNECESKVIGKYVLRFSDNNNLPKQSFSDSNIYIFTSDFVSIINFSDTSEYSYFFSCDGLTIKNPETFYTYSEVQNGFRLYKPNNYYYLIKL